MKQHWQQILLGGTLAAALAACSSPMPPDNTSGTSGTSGTSATSGSSGTSGSTGSSDAIDNRGVNSGVNPPPVTEPSSMGGVIDDRINNDKDVPGKTN
jgi:hypothetical protein